MPSTIVVTGGAGFIGSHVARAFLRRGDRVRILDNLDPFYDPASKHHNVEETRACGAVDVIEGDIRDDAVVEHATRDADAVVHLAALVGVRPSIREPARYADVNVHGTQVLLDTLRGRPDVPLIFGSSSSIYGATSQVPFRESDPAVDPVSPYAATKRAGELMARAFHTRHGNPVTCLRFFTVYGPGQRPEMAIHKFARLIANGEPVPMFGDGSSERDYTWVEDIVSGVLAALDRAGGFHTYNLGASATTTLAELIERVGEAIGKEPTVAEQPDQPGDVPRTFADVSLAEAELGYRVTVPVSDGIPRFVRWYLGERQTGRLA